MRAAARCDPGGCHAGQALWRLGLVLASQHGDPTAAAAGRAALGRAAAAAVAAGCGGSPRGLIMVFAGSSDYDRVLDTDLALFAAYCEEAAVALAKPGAGPGAGRAELVRALPAAVAELKRLPASPQWLTQWGEEYPGLGLNLILFFD